MRPLIATRLRLIATRVPLIATRPPRAMRAGPPALALALVLGALLAIVGVAGPATAPARAADPSAPPSPWYHLADGAVVIDVWYGYSTTCPHCAVASPWLADLAARSPWMEVHPLRVDGDGPQIEANRELLVRLAASIDEEVRGVPAFLFGERLRLGFDTPETTGVALEQELRAYHAAVSAAIGPTPPAGESPAPSRPASPAPTAAPGTAVNLPFVGTVDAASVSLPLLTLVLGGLDAVNPCALSVLMFLMASLAGSRDRRRLLLVGGTFVLAIGAVYFVLMAAWLNLFLLVGELRVVTVLAGIAAVVAGAINAKDFGWFRVGPSLVIPEAAKPSLFGRMLDISEGVRLSAMLASTVLVAVSVSAYEMLCTGGFPVVFTRVLTLAELPLAAYYGYLLLYVAVFVLPLALIVAAFAATLGSRGVSVDEARRLKLLSGLLMLGLGGLLLFAPDRLTDLAWTLALFGGAIGLWVLALVAERARRRGSPA